MPSHMSSRLLSTIAFQPLYRLRQPLLGTLALPLQRSLVPRHLLLPVQIRSFSNPPNRALFDALRDTAKSGRLKQLQAEDIIEKMVALGRFFPSEANITQSFMELLEILAADAKQPSPQLTAMQRDKAKRQIERALQKHPRYYKVLRSVVYGSTAFMVYYVLQWAAGSV